MSSKPTLYIAHNFAAREWLKTVITPILSSQGIVIMSSWLFDDEIFHQTAAKCARQDLFDIDRSDSLLVFEDQYGETGISGKYIETGYALHANKNVIVMNSNDPASPKGRIVFFDLPQVKRVDNIYQAIEVVKEHHKRLYES